MDNNRGQTIFLSVIGIATLLVAIIGATFAYFTTTMTGDAGDVNVGTATLGKSTFAVNKAITSTNALPGWKDTATITLTLEPSDYDVNYACYLNVTTSSEDADAPITSSDLDEFYVMTAVNADSTALSSDITLDAATELALKNRTDDKIKIAHGTLKAGTSNTVHKIDYTIHFKETGTDQNTLQGKTLAATVTCELASDENSYYTNKDGNNNNPTTKPEAE